MCMRLETDDDGGQGSHALTAKSEACFQPPSAINRCGDQLGVAGFREGIITQRE